MPSPSRGKEDGRVQELSLSGDLRSRQMLRKRYTIGEAIRRKPLQLD